MLKLTRGHLGFYAPGSTVVLGEWVPNGFGDQMVVAREWRGGWWNPTRHRVIGNYASTTGVIVVEHLRTRARTECDAYTPVVVDQCEAATK